MTLVALLLPFVIGLTWLRLIRPGAKGLQGTPILSVPLPLLARIRMHILPTISAFALGLALAIGGAVPWWAVVTPIVSFLLLVALPLRYTLTSAGIRLGWSSFRRWTEFAGVRRAPGGARLVGMHKLRGFHIWLSGSRGDDEFIQFLRQTLRNSYKGTAFVVPLPRADSTARPADHDHFQHGVAAFTGKR